MAGAELYTINVFQTKDRKEPPTEDGTDTVEADVNKPIGEFQNMVSARIVKGRMLELEHSDLAGPEVKFKTVINYERVLEPNTFIGISFKSQDGYITKPEDEE